MWRALGVDRRLTSIVRTMYMSWTCTLKSLAWPTRRAGYPSQTRRASLVA